MKQKIISALFLSLFLVGTCIAFDLIETIPLRSTDRQEARINNHWLIIEETNSWLNGFITPENDYGVINISYEGHNYLDEYLSVDTEIKIEEIWDGSYGYHFSGNAENLYYYEDGEWEVIHEVAVSGFYNPQSKQIYVSFNSQEIGMTWVTFINNALIPIYPQPKR